MGEGLEVYVYRVYSTYHSDKDSYVNEYGTYSTLEKAQERLRGIIAKEGDPEKWEWSETGHSVRRKGGWPGEDDAHYIDMICLDHDTQEKTTVWT